MRRRGTPLLAGSLLFAACGGDEAGGGLRTVERDSAGVTIVENPPLAEADAFATLDPIPLLEIGALDGPPEHRLYIVRDAHRFPDGRLAIANGGSHEVRFYDTDGRHLRSTGGEGDGPGEFRNVVSLWPRPGDSLWAWDTRHRSFTVLDLEGRFVGTVPLDADDGLGILAGVFDDGAVLLQGIRVFGSSRAPEPGLQRPPVAVGIHRLDGSLERSLGEWPGNEMFSSLEDGRRGVRGLVFGRDLHTLVVGDRVAIGTTDARSFRLLRRTGDVERIVRVAGALDPVEPGDFERHVDDVLETSANDDFRAFWRRLFDAMPRHESYPAYSEIEADAARRLWLADYRPPGVERRMWTVFGPDGHLLGRVRTPDGLRVLEIGEDYILGVSRDELDVERVQVFALEPDPEQEDEAPARGAIPNPSPDAPPRREPPAYRRPRPRAARRSTRGSRRGRRPPGRPARRRASC